MLSLILDTPFVRHALIAGMVGGLLWTIGMLMARARPRQMGTRQSIRPSPVLMTVTTVLCVGLGLAILYIILFVAPGKGAAVGVALGVAFVGGGLLTACNFAPYFAISWDDEGITGPSGYVWVPGRQQITMPWSSVTDAGKNAMSMWFVEDESGRRILWNQFYGGFVDLMMAIEERCPQLFPVEGQSEV